MRRWTVEFGEGLSGSLAVEPLQALQLLLERFLLRYAGHTNAEILDSLLTKWEDMGFHFASLEELP